MNDNALTVEEKAKLCEYYRVNPKAHAKNLIEHCEGQNSDNFPAAEQFSFERGVTAKLSKMMIARIMQRVQQPLTAFFS